VVCLRRVQLSLADFTLIRRIGEGSFAQVLQVRHKKLGKEYALKIVDKHLVVRYKQVGAPLLPKEQSRYRKLKNKALIVVNTRLVVRYKQVGAPHLLGKK
jgi:serine/threonine protein kinase